METQQPGLKPHFWRHLFSGGLVFIAGICADLVILEYRHEQLVKMPHTVKWIGGELQYGYDLNRKPVVPTNGVAQIGIMDNGQLVWRPK